MELTEIRTSLIVMFPPGRFVARGCLFALLSVGGSEYLVDRCVAMALLFR